MKKATAVKAAKTLPEDDDNEVLKATTGAERKEIIEYAKKQLAKYTSLHLTSVQPDSQTGSPGTRWAVGLISLAVPSIISPL